MSSRGLLPGLALACLAACTQPAAVVDEVSAPPLPEAEYRKAASSGAAVFRIDPLESLLLVRVGRAGRLGRLGHEHAVASEDIEGRIALFEPFERSHADVVFPIRNLLVDRPEHRERFAFDTEPTADDIAGTYANMLKVLDPALFPWAAIRARVVSGSADDTELAISVTLHGTTFEYLLPAAVETAEQRLVVSGTASVRHSEFGLEPYTAAGGLLRVADEIDVEFRLVAYRADTPARATGARPDPHSYARPDNVIVRHLALDLETDFDARRLSGTATVSIENQTGADVLILDANDLEIRSVTLLPSGQPAEYELSPEDPILGSALSIGIMPGTDKVRIDYATSPDAPALQWLSPAQTTSGKPFLFSQSQAILARSWVPVQDSPGVRFTYDARLRVRPDLMAVMSAENGRQKSQDGVYVFSMRQAIPAYLMAIAVGDLAFHELGPRSGVYAEPSAVDAAAREFAEVEAMLDAAEALYGPYLWGRYDLLVLPPSFPYGGMENPRLTYVTPTLLAGDRSLVNVVAHEIAHSWSGNLVTNATWSDFWLNEGFSSYVELRIMEAVRGADYAEMLWGLSLNDLENEIDRLGADSPKTHLYLDVSGDNPDDDLVIVAYKKGAAFLRRLERYVGRDRWDRFLIDYFDAHAFEAIDTGGFVAYLNANLLDEEYPGPAPSIDDWIYGPGLPDDYVRPSSGAFAAVEAQLGQWLGGGSAGDIDTAGWSTQEWLHFLNELPVALGYDQLAELDSAFGLTHSGNAEIRSAWYEVAIRNDYEPSYAALEEFLIAVGRRKFLQPLYTALAADADGLEFARRVYARARRGYHAVSAETIDRILAWEP